VPELLERLGVKDALDGAVCIHDAVDHVRFSDPAFEFSFPQGWESLERALLDQFPADADRLSDLLSRMKTSWGQSRHALVQEGGRNIDALFAGPVCSLQQAIDRCTENPVLGALLSCHGILYGASAKETSLLFHSQVVGSYFESAGFIRGGGRILIEAFEHALGRERVEVLCGRTVRRIDVNDRREFAAVELDTGERLTARRCLCTVHPKLMLEMLPPEAFSPAYRRRVSELEETPSAVVLFGRRRPGGFQGNLILVTEPHTVADWAQVPLENRPLFVSVPPEAESRGVSVICPATLADLPGGGRERSPEYREWKARTAERLLQRLRGCAGDVLGDFDLLDVATPLTFRDHLSSPQGGLYGVKHRLADMPLLSRTTVKGLYLSGQAVVAPGVLGAMCAGLLTESSIV
jgi:all-trans-retinol 13,14-reductase